MKTAPPVSDISGITLRPTRPEDLPSLGALFAERFGHSLPLEDWSWKYREIPGEGRSLVAVDPGGAVVAHAGALCLPARWRGGEAGVWQLVDFAGTTRRRGLRATLVDLGRELLAGLPRPGDVPWIFGFPSERHFRLGEHVFGYRPLSRVEPLAGPLPEVASSASIETGDSCSDWAEAAWEACCIAGVRRSAAFLNWRYHARPRRYYRFYRLADPSGTPGLAVFSFMGEEAWAAELWLPPGEWRDSMLAVAADLRATGFRSWRFWPPPDGSVLEGLGLGPLGELVFIGCRGEAEGAFHYAMGDYDVV